MTPSARVRGPALRAVKLTLTEACNLTCPYCYQRDRHGRTMSLETLQAALLLVGDLGRRGLTVVLSGGEPLLVPELVDVVLDAAAPDEGAGPPLRIRVISNGLLLTSPLLARLAGAGVDLQLSCDGVAAAQERRAPGTWRRLDGLLAAIRQGYPSFWRRHLSVALTVTPDNVGSLARSVAWAFDRDVHRLEVGLACGLLEDGDAWDGALLAEQMEEVHTLSLRHLRRTERIPVTYLRPVRTAVTATADACGAADLTTLAVSVDGSVDGCGLLADVARWHRSVTVRRAAESARLGNVSDPGLADHWRARVARPPGVLFPTADRAAPGRPCGECSQRLECVVCPLAGGEPQAVPDAHCRFESLAQEHRKALARHSPVPEWLAVAGVPGAMRPALAHLIGEARQAIS